MTTDTNGMTLGEFFCFTPNRTNFEIDPVRDAAHLFGDESWRVGIETQLKRSIVLDRPLRLVWIGQYGIGKTHRIYHTMYIVESKRMPILPINVTCTDIGDKTGFESLHYQLVNDLDFAEMRQHAKGYMRGVMDHEEGFIAPEEISQSSDASKAIRALGGDNDALAHAAWKYLAGLPLNNSEYATIIGVTKPQLNTSVEYASVLGLLGSIIRAVTGKRLLYLVDQMEAVSKISNKTTAARWVETLRAILDLKTVSFAATVGAESESLDELPRIFLEPEIVRRFGEDNYHQMRHLQEVEMEKFLQQMLAVWVDQERLAEVTAAEGWSTNPDFDASTYPFTAPAFDRLARHLAADAARSKPSVVKDALNNIAAEAYLSGQRLIDDSVLDDYGIYV